MAYDETPKKPIEIREGRREGFEGHDELIAKAKNADRFGVRTDAAAEGCDYIGVDDIDRMRRDKIWNGK